MRAALFCSTAAGLLQPLRGFAFPPAAPTTGLCPNLRCRSSRQPLQGIATMRVHSNKGKNGPCLTNVQRAITTRQRVASEKDANKVMISNLDYSLTEEDIREFCQAAGDVVAVKLIRKRNAKTSKGYGFVDFTLALSATIAIEELNGRELRGRIVAVKPAFRAAEKAAADAHREYQHRRSLAEEENVAVGR